jgi:hypothetical protein
MTTIMNKSFLVIALLCMSFSTVNAQDRLFEFSARGAMLSSAEVVGAIGYAGLGLNGELMYFIKPKLAAGIFYAQTPSKMGFSSIEYEGGTSSIYGDFEYAMYGLAVQATTNRARFFRIYATARFFKVEMVHHYPEYTLSIAESGYAYSGGFGVTLKFSETVGFNLFEISYVGLPKSFTFAKEFNSQFGYAGALLQSGLVLKIRKRK